MVYTPNRRQTHCAFCGTRFTETRGWPRDCPKCRETTWQNPAPVAVALLPVTDAGAATLVVARRTIEPKPGELSLPGGYLETGETWQQGAVRELFEETGIRAGAADVRLFDVGNAPTSIQVFGLLPARPVDELPPSEPTEESEGWVLLPGPRELAFPTHTAAAAKFFTGRAFETVGLLTEYQ